MVSAELYSPDRPLQLARGEALSAVTVDYETYGTLAPDASNAIFVCHALTGDAHVGRWWQHMVGPGKAIDTNRWFVVCANLLGGCSGTTGPASINPETGKPWGLDFPLLDMSDFVSVHRRLAEHLGIEKWHAVVGPSLGGMQTLQWALDYPEDMDKAVIIASTSKLSSQNIAFSAVGREAIMTDENFADGRFLESGVTPDTGLAVARMMAHITYSSETAFDKKFGRRPQFGESQPGFGIDFAIESYLHHQGESFLTRFNALSYLYLTRVMDYFDPFGQANALAKLESQPVSFLVVSFTTDWRFSTAQSWDIVRQLQPARVPVSFVELDSPGGHDSFLLPDADLFGTVRPFLESPGRGGK